MVVASNTDLEDFLNGLEEDKKVAVIEKETTVWEDIFSALDRWKQTLVDAESLSAKSNDIQREIESIIRREEIDGLLSVQDASELRYVADLWMRLLHDLNSYHVGCTSVKRNIITSMLELYNLRQIDEETFITSCEKL